MSCDNGKPKCCTPPGSDKCPPPPPSCANVPDTPTFTCPSDDCEPKVKPACPEKKDDKCICVGPCSDGGSGGGSKQKKC
ncbi:unnamed protein product [Orchesella dallaii]|uniref:Uncharacterized protein n=1 Tax=Orchesella dallaii TaxID=48710 RepID=A0ABP1QV07_9HEXA